MIGMLNPISFLEEIGISSVAQSCPTLRPHELEEIIIINRSINLLGGKKALSSH